MGKRKFLNVNPLSYVPSIQHLVDTGYHVIRLGKGFTEKFPFSHSRFCLGSPEIRKIGISFIIGYHTLNQLKEMPYVQTSTSQIFRRSKN